jgi:hypothetical protein
MGASPICPVAAMLERSFKGKTDALSRHNYKQHGWRFGSNRCLIERSIKPVSEEALHGAQRR